jgi:hypothetical protein
VASAAVTLASAAPSSSLQPERVNPHAAALAELEARLESYVQMRKGLERKLAPLSTTPSPAELTSRQASLAEAMRLSRQGARPGDLVPTGATEFIRQTVRQYVTRQTAPEREAMLKDVPDGTPVINAGFPPQAAMPTTPPLLLRGLPPLPDNLQYRFYGTHVAIVDGDLDIIVDCVADALPPQ